MKILFLNCRFKGFFCEGVFRFVKKMSKKVNALCFQEVLKKGWLFKEILEKYWLVIEGKEIENSADYVSTVKEVKTFRFEVAESNFSDHLPMVVEIFNL